jgi:hypothetical protein
VKIISSMTDKDTWVESFLSNPNELVYEVDVLIATPTITAGHSIDVGIHKVFGFLHLDVLTHEDEIQFLSRACRSPTLESLDVYRQKGTAGRSNASYEKQKIFTSVSYNNYHGKTIN